MQQKLSFTPWVRNVLGHFCTSPSESVSWISTTENFKSILQPPPSIFYPNKQSIFLTRHCRVSCLKKNSLSFLRNSSTHWGQIKIISEVCFYNQGRQWYCTWWDVKMPSECLVPYKTFSTNSASLFVYVLLSFQVQIFLPFSMFFFFLLQFIPSITEIHVSE